MGIGRFAYTPILPLMTAQAAVTPQVAGQLATANYVGYLAGALAGTASSRLTRSAIACRASLIVLVATLAAMPFASNTIGWLAMRTIAGFTSAVVFVIAVNSLLDHLGDHSPHLPGWGFGGVGIGVALSGALVLALPTANRVVDGGGVRGGAERLRVDNGRNQKAHNGFRGCSDARASA
jgi:MFS family permease